MTDAPSTEEIRLYRQVQSTIFIDRLDPGQGTLGEYEDGSWVVDIPPGKAFSRALLVALAHEILDAT